MTDLVGGRLSHYRIVGSLGAGGMGVVYRAHDERLGRDLALKVLPAGSLADASARARLVREAQTASSLNHPHIAHIYEVGEDQGQMFIAMELVDGRPLRELTPESGWPAESLLRYGTQIADALGYAHERGVIHRDLKSANVMITTEGRAKVLDFGLAKRMRDDRPDRGSNDLSLTAPGMMVGTPNYLPPEVLLGGDADARSDVWALGVVLYEMATGKLPFSGASLPELAGTIVSGAPGQLPGRVAGSIQTVIYRCLEKKPENRYANGSEVRKALEEILSGRPVARVGDSHRPRAWAIAAWVVVAGLAVAVPMWMAQRRGGQADRPAIRSLAVLPLVNLSGDPEQEYFADGMTEELLTNLAPIQSLKVISRTSVMRFKGSKEPLSAIAKQLGVEAVIEGSVQRAGDRVRITAQLIEAATDRHLWANSYERDFKDVLALQSDVARDIVQQVRLQVSPEARSRAEKRRPIHPEAYELYLKGRYEWNKLSLESLNKSIEYFKQGLALDPGDARQSSGLADAYLMLNQFNPFPSPAEGIGRVKEYARRALSADDGSAEAHASMAAALFFGDWNLKDSEFHARRSIELNPGYPTGHLVLSVILMATGRTGEGIEEDRLARELDPLSFIINWNAVSTMLLARRFDDALTQAERTLKLAPESEMAQGTLVFIYEQKGDYAGALRLLEQYLPESEGGKPFVAKLRAAYAAAGAKGYWRARLDDYLARGKTGAKVLPVQVAQMAARLGDTDRAIAELERAFDEHSGDMLFLNVEPSYDPIRADPRFQALVRRVGLTPLV